MVYFPCLCEDTHRGHYLDTKPGNDIWSPLSDVRAHRLSNDPTYLQTSFSAIVSSPHNDNSIKFTEVYGKKQLIGSIFQTDSKMFRTCIPNHFFLAGLARGEKRRGVPRENTKEVAQASFPDLHIRPSRILWQREGRPPRPTQELHRCSGKLRLRHD